MKNNMKNIGEKVKKKFNNFKERLKELTERLKAFPSKYAQWWTQVSAGKQRQLKVLAAYFLLIAAVFAGVYIGQDHTADRIKIEPMDQDRSALVEEEREEEKEADPEAEKSVASLSDETEDDLKPEDGAQDQEGQAEVGQSGSENFIWPAEGDVIVEFHEVYNVENQYQLHSGINIKSKEGDPVSASLSGEVQEVKDNSLSGKKVIISHPHEVNTIYANLSSVKVTAGDEVAKGHIIGMTGSTAQMGAIEGPFLYFGVTDRGEYRDPLKYLP